MLLLSADQQVFQHTHLGKGFWDLEGPYKP